MERNAFNNARYHRRELLEINPVPISDSDDFLESSVYKALSLTGHWVKANELQACHRLKKMGTFVGCSFRRACVARTMSYLINLDTLKNAGKNHSTWYWNNSVNVKLDKRSQPTKIHNVIDIEKLLCVDNFHDFTNNTFSLI